MNQLASSASAYLSSAAHQPINWYEFTPEAFKMAKELDRPVLLDIGAVWCHWCHVIDRESYENAEIAALINAHFVAIKVDRDQRPDIDARYQKIIQDMSGQGGWPLTAFLTYEGECIYGGTYFPPQTMKQLLARVRDVYKERRTDILEGHAKTRADFARREQDLLAQQVSTPVETEVLNHCLSQIRLSLSKRADSHHGGFGEHPKFPHFSALQFMLMDCTHAKTANTETRMHLEKTLIAMAEGGLYDQIGGGFHRYSVDAEWHVPHFEKMAYDNAEALITYAQAYRLFRNPLFKTVALETGDWVNDTLSNQEEGGFYASQDADIDLSDDGNYFTWSLGELRDVLSDEVFNLVKDYYDIHAVGDMHHEKGRNVLHVSMSLDTLAKKYALSVEKVSLSLKEASGQMLGARKKRVTPFIDTTLYTNWNSMMIAAYFEASLLLNEASLQGFATLSLERVLRELHIPGQVVLHSQGVEGFLEDYSWLAMACLKGYYATADETLLHTAEAVAVLMIDKFDSGTMGFFDTQHASLEETGFSVLQHQRVPVEDNPSSSANGIALQVLYALALITENAAYQECFEKHLSALSRIYAPYGLYVSALGMAAQCHDYGMIKLDVVGQDETLIKAAKNEFYPGKVLHYKPLDDAQDVKPHVLVCKKQQCYPLVFSAEALRTQVEAF